MSWWDVILRTDSGQFRTVKLEGYSNYEDARDAALSSTGAKSVYSISPGSSPVTKQPIVLDSPYIECTDYDDYKHKQLIEELDEINDELNTLEEQMYFDLCYFAYAEGKEPPTVEEFYEWLENNN